MVSSKKNDQLPFFLLLERFHATVFEFRPNIFVFTNETAGM